MEKEFFEDISRHYYDIRLEYYEDRKDNLIDILEKQLLILSNKAKYIQELLNGTIDLRKKKKQEIIDLLNNKEYDVIDNDEEFKYLVRMPMDSVSEENVEKLLKDYETKEVELNIIKETTIQQMWLSELEILENEYVVYKREREQSQVGITKKKAINKVTGGTKKMVKKTSKVELEIE